MVAIPSHYSAGFWRKLPSGTMHLTAFRASIPSRRRRPLPDILSFAAPVCPIHWPLAAESRASVLLRWLNKAIFERRFREHSSWLTGSSPVRLAAEWDGWPAVKWTGVHLSSTTTGCRVRATAKARRSARAVLRSRTGDAGDEAVNDGGCGVVAQNLTPSPK